MTPQVLVTLAPNGSLIAELPGANGSRRQIPLKGDCEATLRRILQGQLNSRVNIGLDGAPTAAQVKHWERHEIWADPTCSFCIAERGLHGRVKPSPHPRRSTANGSSTSRHSAPVEAGRGVEVRRLSKQQTEKERKALIKRADKALRAKQDAERTAELTPFFRSIGL